MRGGGWRWGVGLGVFAALGRCAGESEPPGTPAGAGGGSGLGGVGGAGGTGPVCLVEFPCLGRVSICTGPSQVQFARDVDCHAQCGPGPCSGSVCSPDGPAFECPVGTTCRDVLDGSGVFTAACVGGPDGSGGVSNADAGPIIGGCGNATLDNVEACDDGNLAAGDGCSPFCRSEPGFICAPGRGCQPDTGDLACSEQACRWGEVCLEPSSSITCGCPSSELPACSAPRWIGLSLPEGARSCFASAVSGDGTTIVGGCSVAEVAGGTRTWRSIAARWTVDGGGSLLPSTLGESVAYDASSDGSVIVGRDAGLGGVRWTASGAEALGDEFGAAVAVSADGRLAVGGDNLGYLWRADGPAVPLRPLDGALQSAAADISEDGLTIVGWQGDPSGSAPLAWSSAGEARTLPGAAATNLVPSALSRDGSVIAGNIWLTEGSSSRAVRWSDTGLDIFGPEDSFVRAISADGAAIFGSIGSTSVVWDSALAPANITSLLMLGGTGIDRWTLDVLDASADGKTVVGSGQYSDPVDGRARAFIAWLP